MTGTAQKLRQLIAGPDVVVIPTVYDALSARIAVQAGFEAVFVSGSAVSAARLGLPDVGLLSFGETLDQLHGICSAIPGVPVLADADTGFGNAMNVRRTVTEYARAGAACLMLEDQVAPKRCGHFDGKQVISAAEARMKIRAAVDAARACDVLVLARTDARGPLGMQEALQRCKSFEEEGADIVFMEAPLDVQELQAYAQAVGKPTMANMSRGARIKLMTPKEIQAVGVRIAVYHPMLHAAAYAMRHAAQALRDGDVAGGPPACTSDDLKAIVDLAGHEALERSYAA